MSEEVETNAQQTESASQESSQESEQPQEWMWAEDVKGQGARPEFLLDKYKSVAEQAKGYSEVVKKLGGFTGAPEEYNVDHLGLDPNQHTLKVIMDIGKDLNMSQEGLDKLVTRLADAQNQESETSIEQEVSKLGDEGEQIMKQYKYFRDNHLHPEEREVVGNWIKSAEDLKTFTAMTKGIYSQRVPTDVDRHLSSHTADTVKELRAEMSKNLERYNSDAEYRKDWKQRLHWANKRENR